ncbi:MAG: SUMF1/EgtB/PvdO family nonheme iron enzyme [Planctomycetota bacterium]
MTTGKPNQLLNGRYRLDERIGFGGMGAVYRATDERLGRVVAVKELRQEYAEDQMIRKRFIREAQTAAQLSHHPHVVTIHDFFEEGADSLYIVMEYLDGGTLLDRMNEAPDRRVDLWLVLRAGCEAAEGLQAAHDLGLVHRDVKPGNLLFDATGKVKLADFGVVTALRREEEITTLTQVGTHPGTLVYMSPEQIDGAEVDGRSDVYSLGAVLYEAIAGVRYFERRGMRRTERALMDAICERPPVPLRQHVPYVPEAVERTLERSLAKLVDERPSARELAEELARIESARPKPQIVRIQPRSQRMSRVGLELPEDDPLAETLPRARPTLGEPPGGARALEGAPGALAPVPPTREPGLAAPAWGAEPSTLHDDEPSTLRGVPLAEDSVVVSRRDPREAPTQPGGPAPPRLGSGAHALEPPETRAGPPSDSARLARVTLDTASRAEATTDARRGAQDPGGRQRVQPSVQPGVRPSGRAERPPRGEPTPPGGGPRITQPQGDRRPRDGAVEVFVPGGPFTMGEGVSSDEVPRRSVVLGPFAIDRTPVTLRQYRAFLGALERGERPQGVPLLDALYTRGKDHRPQGWGSAEFSALCASEDHPIVLVDWFDACAYAAWVGARLPTEAEWERAARGAEDARSYPWGDEPATPERALYGRRTAGPQPVGALPLGASPDGALDLAGNVWEWCLDAYAPDAYAALPERDPHLPVDGPRARAVKRGGSWTNAPHSLRCSKRAFEKLHIRRNNLGFRCARPR